MKVGALCIKKEGAHFDTPSNQDGIWRCWFLIISYAIFIIIFLYFIGWTHPAEHNASEEAWWPLLILSVKLCHIVLFSLFLILSIICTAFAACIPKKIHRDFRLTVPRLYSWVWVMLFLSAEAASSWVTLSLESSLLRIFLNCPSFAALSLRTKEVWQIRLWMDYLCSGTKRQATDIRRG